jgi:hypothetical protein
MLSGYQSYSINLTGYYYLSLPPFVGREIVQSARQGEILLILPISEPWDRRAPQVASP